MNTLWEQYDSSLIDALELLISFLYHAGSQMENIRTSAAEISLSANCLSVLHMFLKNDHLLGFIPHEFRKSTTLSCQSM